MTSGSDDTLVWGFVLDLCHSGGGLAAIGDALTATGLPRFARNDSGRGADTMRLDRLNNVPAQGVE